MLFLQIYQGSGWRKTPARLQDWTHDLQRMVLPFLNLCPRRHPCFHVNFRFSQSVTQVVKSNNLILAIPDYVNR